MTALNSKPNEVPGKSAGSGGKKAKNTGLGRGLEAIFIDNAADESGVVSALRISDIEPRPGQPRKDFDAESLAALAESIAANGMIQPLVVRASDKNDGGCPYQIVAGERRWRAAKIAGLNEIPVIIMELDDRQTAEIALIENVQREDLNPVEEAMAFRALIGEYGLTQEEVSKRIGRSRSAVANSLRLLELPETVLDMISAGALTAGHARALLGIKDTGAIDGAAQLIIKKDLSVRAAEELARTLNREAEKIDEQPAQPDGALPEIDYSAQLERLVTSTLGRQVRILMSKGKNSATGKIQIEYSDNDDLEDLIKKLCGDDIFEGA